MGHPVFKANNTTGQDKRLGQITAILRTLGILASLVDIIITNFRIAGQDKHQALKFYLFSFKLFHQTINANRTSQGGDENWILTEDDMTLFERVSEWKVSSPSIHKKVILKSFQHLSFSHKQIKIVSEWQLAF